MSEATKNDSEKAPMQYLPSDALMEVAQVFGFGAKKYGGYNYMKGMDWSRLIGAAYRHLTQFNGGYDLDEETKRSHIAHATCCMLMLLQYQLKGLGKDDRYKKE